MPRLIPALVTGAVLISTLPAVAQDGPALDSVDSRVSYALGLQMARSLAENGGVALDIEAFEQAIADVNAGTEPRLTQDEIAATFQELGARVAEGKLTENAAFLADNGAAEGVTTTDSGLQYKVTEAGSGDSPAASDTVTVHYEGRLLNGTVFDSSIARGEPATFPVGGVIQGWQEVLQLMSPGATWEVWIPSALAYGTQGAGQAIGPNEVLNFTIQLISVEG